MERHHESVEHTADTGIRAYASDLGGLFEECAAAMFGVMYAPQRTQTEPNLDVAVSGQTLEDLLVAWLSDLLFAAEVNHLALDTFEVETVGDGVLRGRAGGTDADDVELHGPPIKAVTYHGLEVAHDGEWRATVIFDV